LILSIKYKKYNIFEYIIRNRKDIFTNIFSGFTRELLTAIINSQDLKLMSLFIESYEEKIIVMIRILSKDTEETIKFIKMLYSLNKDMDLYTSIFSIRKSIHNIKLEIIRKEYIIRYDPIFKFVIYYYYKYLYKNNICILG